jgi:hypothetical protein
LNFKPDKSLDEYNYSYPSKSEDEKRDKDALVRHFDKTREIPKTTKSDSVWWLEVDPEQTDPKALQFAPGYRVYLLLRDKVTKNWTFPKLQNIGARSFMYYRNKIIRDTIGANILFHHLGPSPALCHTTKDGELPTLSRPTFFSEDIYNMIFERTKVLFP